jgi:hypothetical protein
MRTSRVALALVLLALAAFAGMLAADVRSWRTALAAGDAQFGESPETARWNAETVLPFDPARAILDLSSQLAFRRAVQDFVAVQAAGNGYDNGYSESRARGALEAVLANLARSSNSRRASEAENLLGILAFSDSLQRGPSAPAPIERSVAGFRTAAQLDPSSEDAKFNLEWLLRKLVARGTRAGTSSGSGGPARGHKGAGGGLPGRGY